MGLSRGKVGLGWWKEEERVGRIEGGSNGRKEKEADSHSFSGVDYTLLHGWCGLYILMYFCMESFRPCSFIHLSIHAHTHTHTWIYTYTHVHTCTCDPFICSQLKAGRSHFLELVSRATSSVDDVTVAFTEYVSLLRGLVDAPTETGGESKLRGLTTFRWTNTLGGRTPT